jgi:hypothetical protein
VMPPPSGEGDPAVECANSGGTWDGSACIFAAQDVQVLAQVVAAAAQLANVLAALVGLLTR